MKKLKSALATLFIALVLSGVIVPVQSVRADDGGDPQGTSDSRSRQSQSSLEASARAWLAWILSLVK